MTRLDLYIESNRNGKTMIHLLDYPGCIIKGISVEDALERLERGISSYMLWRKQGGFSFLNGPYDYGIQEEMAGGPFSPGSKAALFLPDEQVVSDQEREEWLELMAASRKSLLEIVENMPENLFDLWIVSKDWSIERILRHIASAERFYITRLFQDGELPRTPPTRSVLKRIQVMREKCVENLRNLTEEQLSIMMKKGSEFWTARKVFRRFLEHEREHIGQILRIIHYFHQEDEVNFDFGEMRKMFQGISWKEDQLG